MHSCIYEGRVRHSRRSPVKHRFTYRLFMAYLDLQELPELFLRRFLIARCPLAPVSYLRRDHLRGFEGPLDVAVRQLVQEQTGTRPVGPIRMLTQLRYFGYFFSPLNLYYCFAADGREINTVVAEVNNTPWGEQHCYVLWDGNRVGPAGQLRFAHNKVFHVSPFMEMNVEYRWRLVAPAEHLVVHLQNARQQETFFDASLTLVRRPLNHSQLIRMLVRYPWMTAHITWAIYFEALRLWWKRCPAYAHPKKRVTVENH